MELRKRDLAACVAGNALEFYDFTTYAYFAVQIGAAFFPAQDKFVSLMLTLLTFGASFIMRPIGAIMIGRYADRVGRKPAMLLSFGLMGAGVFALAITPSYAQIGVVAPIAVLAIRLVQGFALGGDVGPTTSFLIEAAPPDKRGLYGALQFTGQGLATVLAGIAGVTLASLLSAAQLAAFGWRIAFLFGVLVVPLGLIVRHNLPETLRPDMPKLPQGPSPQVWRIALLGLLSIMGSTTGFYVLAYMSTYAQIVLNMKVNVSFAATLVFGVCNVVFSVIAGWISDRVGRRPLMIWPRIAIIVLAYPAFLLITTQATAVTLLAATATLAVFTQSGGAVSLVWLTEALPARVRSATMASVYAIGVALFGGTTQPIVTELLHVTGDKFAPAWWLIATTFICLAATFFMEETAPAKTGRPD